MNNTYCNVQAVKQALLKRIVSQPLKLGIRGTGQAMTEAGFTRYIMTRVSKKIYTWKIANMYQNGVPDCYFSGPKGDLWVEMKYITAPKRETTFFKPKLAPLQLQWLNARQDEGRNVGLVLGSNIGCWIYRNNFEKPMCKSNLSLTRKEIIKWIETETLA